MLKDKIPYEAMKKELLKYGEELTEEEYEKNITELQKIYDKGEDLAKGLPKEIKPNSLLIILFFLIMMVDKNWYGIPQKEIKK